MVILLLSQIQQRLESFLDEQVPDPARRARVKLLSGDITRAGLGLDAATGETLDEYEGSQFTREILASEGVVEGRILSEPRGDNGFGYDPLFFHPPSGCRLSELTPDEKNAISHRGEALRNAAARTFECSPPSPSRPRHWIFAS